MIHVCNPDHFQEVLAFAAQAGALGALLDQLCYLSAYGEQAAAPVFDETRRIEQLAWALTHEHEHGHVCQLSSDFAPHSFGFGIATAPGRYGLCGGVIYRAGGDARQPHRWSVHT